MSVQTNDALQTLDEQTATCGQGRRFSAIAVRLCPRARTAHPLHIEFLGSRGAHEALAAKCRIIGFSILMGPFSGPRESRADELERIAFVTAAYSGNRLSSLNPLFKQWVFWCSPDLRRNSQHGNAAIWPEEFSECSRVEGCFRHWDGGIQND